MRILLLGLFFIGKWALFAQTPSIKENLGANINSAQDQIIPVFSLDGQTLYFSENGGNGRYEVWTSRRDAAGDWQPKRKADGLNPPTDGSKYVFAQVENDLLLVNGWFDKTDIAWEQSKGLSWYIPSQDRFIPLDIPALQTQAQGRFVNTSVHIPSRTLLLSYSENDQKDIYVCRPEDASVTWTSLTWQAPARLAAPLNSEYDDTTPFLDADGQTLYFASNRPGGYGGDDIYRSQRMDDTWTNWSPPENLGFRVNSNFSEIYYCISPVRDFVYFVSYKHSYGSGDIFRLRTDSTQEMLTVKPPPSDDISPSPTPPVEVTELTVEEYRPNNLVFLIDRSASMRPAHKLPLLKLSLKRLIGQLRNIDRLTLISFANTATIDFSTEAVTQKDSLYQLLDEFVASGKTKANQGLQLAYDSTTQNFIDGGNNEIILVTDGLFSLSEQDQDRIATNGQIVLSTVGLGDNQSALQDLRELAGHTNGSFIHIRNAEAGTEALLEEVKERSRR